MSRLRSLSRRGGRPRCLAIALGMVLLVSPAFAAEDAGWLSSDGEELRGQVERGPVRVELVVRPAEPQIGDVIEVELEVRAAAGVEVLNMKLQARRAIPVKLHRATEA